MNAPQWFRGGHRAARLLFALVLSTGSLLAPASSARAGSLRAEFTSLAARPRSGASAFVDVKLHWQGTGLLEGVLEVTLHGSAGPLLQQRTHELALTSGAQTFRLLLPPLPTRDYDLATEAQLFFRTRNDAIDLGRFPFSNPTYGTRSFLIAVCGARRSLQEGQPRLWQGLRPERFLPASAGAPPSLATSPAMLEPEDLPAAALGYCAFDLVLLEGESFARLREKQLAALARWIEAGGSLCIFPAGVLREEHLRFLNGLAATRQNAPPFHLDERGYLVGGEGNLRFAKAELGRLVVATRAPETAAEMEAPEWSHAAMFLWKFTDARIAAGARGAVLGTNPLGSDQNEERQRREAIQPYLNRLLPSSTRFIPLPVIAAILGAFILIVGPGEWFALGWLRRRRWTWLTFPLIATAFTALTVAAAEHYLGSEDHRAALVITDVGRAGKVLRENRLEMLFAARDQEATTELRQNLAVPTQLASRNYRMPEAAAGPPLYEGQFPARAQLRQGLRQWTPQVNRLLTFDAPPDTSGIRWEAVTARGLAGQKDAASWFATQAGATGFDCHVFARNMTKDPRGTTAGGFQFMRSTSVMPARSLGALFARLSPSGAANLLDLALTDETAVNEWIVTATKSSPGEIRIYRRLYRTDE